MKRRERAKETERKQAKKIHREKWYKIADTLNTEIQLFMATFILYYKVDNSFFVKKCDASVLVKCIWLGWYEHSDWAIEVFGFKSEYGKKWQKEENDEANAVKKVTLVLRISDE